ncbi:MAG: hypothetical protein DRI52_07510 [Chloroflexi bacterium]|nr:hypothetical protein [Anaerolineae bacterium]RLC70211.1 MAG: hypothetical protein DRI52_07510 [Chloroflexota bacterium]
MKLNEYERSPITRGMHGWVFIYKKHGTDILKEMVAAKFGWFKILDDGGGNNIDTCRWLREHDIMPVVRFYRTNPNPGKLPPNALDTVKRYVDEGITRWFEVNNEPNIDGEWMPEYRPTLEYGNADIVMPNWLEDAEAIIQLGGYPAFPAMAHCGRKPREGSTTTYERYFEWLVTNAYDRAKYVFEHGAWFAMHPYIFNHGYKDEDGVWHFEYPYDPICQADDPGRTAFDDDVGLGCTEVPSQLLKKHFGLDPLPVLGTEGAFWGWGDDRYPEYKGQAKAEAHVAMFDWMATQGPPCLFGLCIWVLNEWFKHDRYIHDRLKETQPALKELPIIEEETITPPTPPIPTPPTGEGAHWASHFVLFPQGADWAWYEAASRYLTFYRVTNGQSADDAGVVHGDLGHTITVINPDDELMDYLLAFKANLDVIRAPTPADLKAIMDARVERNDRYGELEERPPD